jgi:hypothetical protein
MGRSPGFFLADRYANLLRERSALDDSHAACALRDNALARRCDRYSGEVLPKQRSPTTEYKGVIPPPFVDALTLRRGCSLSQSHIES